MHPPLDHGQHAIAAACDASGENAHKLPARARPDETYFDTGAEHRRRRQCERRFIEHVGLDRATREIAPLRGERRRLEEGSPLHVVPADDLSGPVQGGGHAKLWVEAVIEPLETRDRSLWPCVDDGH